MRQFLIDDKIRSQKLRAYQEDGDFGTRQSAGNVLLPLSTGRDHRIVPAKNFSVALERGGMDLEPLQPLRVSMAIANKNSISYWSGSGHVNGSANRHGKILLRVSAGMPFCSGAR